MKMDLTGYHSGRGKKSKASERNRDGTESIRKRHDPERKKGTETKKTETDDSRAETGIYLGLLKPHMAVALGIILLIVFIGQMIYRSQFDTVFYAAIINGTAGDGEALAEDFKNYTGDTDKYHEYTIDNSMYLMKDQEDYQMVMKLSTIIGAQVECIDCT